MSLYAASALILAGVTSGALTRRPPTGPRPPALLVVIVGALTGIALIFIDQAAIPFGAGRTLALGLAAGALALAATHTAAAAALLIAAGASALASLSDPAAFAPTELSMTGTPWSLVHVVFGIGSTAATAIAATYAALALRRSPLALVVLALVVTALPLASRAGDLVLHAGGAPLFLDVPILDPDGAQGLVRRVVATWRHPAEWLLRAVASAGLVVFLFASIRSRTASSPLPHGIARLAFALVGLHALFYVAFMLPLSISADPARALARLFIGELQGTESLPLFTLPDLSGGLRASGFPLLLAMVALWFTWLSSGSAIATSPADATAELREGALLWTDTPEDRRTERAAHLAATLLGATVLTGTGWSNYAWGDFLPSDPKLFAGIVSLGFYGLYFWARVTLPRWGSARATLVLVAGLVTVWSLIGPPLGLVSPSLHDFGR